MSSTFFQVIEKKETRKELWRGMEKIAVLKIRGKDEFIKKKDNILKNVKKEMIIRLLKALVSKGKM